MVGRVTTTAYATVRTNWRFACRAARGAASVISLWLAMGGLAPAAAGDQAQHPRLLVQGEGGRVALQERLAQDPAAAGLYAAIRARVMPYVERHRSDPAWIVSRLQMYWQEKRTTVFVKDGIYDHAEGAAPVPTVRFTGGRDTATAYTTPRLEDVKPYMGERDLLFLQNKTLPGQPWEWVTQAKTGRIVESINMRIADLARDAAFLYWFTGDEDCARFAYDVFDTYMTGLYYRAMPVDLNRAHDQTIVGLQSYEVIHEDIVGPLTETYDFMHDYVRQRGGDKAALYDASFKRWADVILANGVPWNNWNLIKARFVLQIAAVLSADAGYADRRGSSHYVGAAIDGAGVRQWGLQRLLDHGYDPATGIWNESPGYSVNVVSDYLECLDMLERVFGIDLLPQMPVLSRAAYALPQYLLPNGRTVGFGDTRYDFLRTPAIEQLQAYAERHGDVQGAGRYARLLLAIRTASGNQGQRLASGDTVQALLTHEAASGGGAAASARPITVATAVPIQEYQSPTFFAPNASWLIQRNGYAGANAREDALVISQAGSSGNHTHANGIAMELYALGLSLAPESGRGSGYLLDDHLQYYAQFPAHNTVLVDGASTYPSMKADHPLVLNAVYPQSATALALAFPLATFSDVSFIEPATQSDQQRVLGTVRLPDGSAYFVDVFRSRRRNGQDKYHDYIYHNLGQSMRFNAPDGRALESAPTDRLSFADGDVFGYDFWRDRRVLTSTQAVTARFDLVLPERAVAMNAWLQGGSGREFFSVQAPPSTAWVAGMLPAGVDKLPLQTLVVRQTGEAWSHPFSTVFEPVAGAEGGRVLAVEELVNTSPRNSASGHRDAQAAAGAYGLRVSTRDGGHQTIIANEGDATRFSHDDLLLRGRYAVIAAGAAGLDYLFLGSGRELAGSGYRLAIATVGGTGKGRGDAAAAALWRHDGGWHFTASQPMRLTVPATGWPESLTFAAGGRQLRVAGRLATTGPGAGGMVRIYELPAMAATRIR